MSTAGTLLDPAAGPKAAAGAATLRLASYNIHAAKGTDRRRDVDRIAAVIEEIDPDIIGLQEVDTRQSRGGLDQAQQIAARLGLHCIEGPVLREESGWYGNAILSKRAGSAIMHWPYPDHSGEPRAALGAQIADASGRLWRIIVTHLDLRFRFRCRQVAALVERLAEPSPDPLVVLADLNEWWPFAPCWQALRRLGEVPGGVRSFPSYCPMLPLDRVVLRNCAALGGLQAHVTAQSRRASDHLPVFVDLRHDGPHA